MDETLVNKQTSKECILESALNLFCQKGYSGAGINEIATESGITKPTLYYYFKSKEGLYRSMWDKNFIPLLDKLSVSTKYENNSSEYEKDVFPVLCNVVKSFFEYAEKNTRFYFHALAILISSEDNDARTTGTAYFADAFLLLREMFEKMGEAHGQIKDHGYQLAITFFGMINAYLSCWRINQKELTDETIKALVKQFMHGIF